MKLKLYLIAFLSNYVAAINYHPVTGEVLRWKYNNF